MRPFTIDRLAEMLADSPTNTFWRHDVDVSPAAALRMAELEADLGIVATYYVMTTSPFYSAADALELAAALTWFDHRVGVHFDWRVSQIPAHGLFSFHCPKSAQLWRDDIGGDRNAYASRWFGRYVADSRGVFADGDPEDRFDGEPLQVNLHPEWWFEPRWADGIDDGLYRSFFHEPKHRVPSPPSDTSARAAAPGDEPAADSYWPYAGAHGGMSASGSR